MILKTKDERKGRDPAEGTKPVDDQVPSALAAVKSQPRKQEYKLSIYANNLYTSILTRQNDIPEESSFKNKMSAVDRTIHRNASEGTLAPATPKLRDLLEQAGFPQDMKTIIEETFPELDNDASPVQENVAAAADSAVWNSVDEESKTQSNTEVTSDVYQVLRDAWKEIVTMDDQETLPCSCHIAQAACVYHLTPNDKDEKVTIPPSPTDITPRSKPKPPWTSSVHVFEDEEDDYDAWKSVSEESKAESRISEASSCVYQVLRNIRKGDIVEPMDDQEPLPACSCHIAQVTCAYHSTPNEKDILANPSSQEDITPRPRKPKPAWTSSVHVFDNEGDKVDEIMKSAHDQQHQHPHEIPTFVCRSVSTQRCGSIISEVTTDIYQQQEDSHKLQDKRQEHAVPLSPLPSTPPRQRSDPQQPGAPQPTGPFANSPQNKSEAAVRLPSSPNKNDSNPFAYPQSVGLNNNTYLPPSTATRMSNSPQESLQVAPSAHHDSPDTTPKFSQEQRRISVQRVSPPSPDIAPVPLPHKESDNSSHEAKKQKTSTGLPAALPFGDDDQDVKSVSRSSSIQHSNNPLESERASLGRVKHQESARATPGRVKHQDMEISYTTIDRETFLHAGSYSGPLNEKGKMNGNGVFWFDNGDLYLGQFADGDLHGVGALSLSKLNQEGKPVILKGYFEHNQFMGERMVEQTS